MFAKLKKKIQEESGSTPSVDIGHGPGLASPVTSPIKRDAPGSDAEAGPFNGSCSDLSDPSGMKDVTTTKEEVLAMLLKRTEQVRKLENKVSELAAKVKEKNKHIEQVEKDMQKHPHGANSTARKISDMNEQYSSNKIRMSDGLTSALREQEESMKVELEKVKGEKSKLESQLQDAEQFKARYFQREEENDEMSGLASQELAKVKHMLLIKEEELTSLCQELHEKQSRLDVSENRHIELKQEVDNLLQQISHVTNTNDQVEARNEVVSAKLTELTKQNSSLQSQLTEMEKNTNKCKSLMEQKDTQLAHASERIISLEKRLKSNHMTGDDLTQAVTSERDKLEKQLEEARKHVSEMKVTYSNHSNHLEAEVARLNKKVIEEREERERSNRDGQRMLENLKLQREELLQRVQIAETRENDTLTIAVEKDKELLLQTEKMEKRMLEETANALINEEKLKKEITGLKSEITKMEKARANESMCAQQKIEDLERIQSDTLEKEIDAERQLSALEANLHSVKEKLNSKEREIEEANARLRNTSRELEAVLKNAKTSEKEMDKHQQRVEELQVTLKALQADYKACNKEKNTLLLRNAHLSQELETEKRKSREKSEGFRKEMQQRECAIQGMEQSLQDHQREIGDHLKKVQDLETQNMDALRSLESSQIDMLKDEVRDLANQVQDKNKTIKMQQQRLIDLKKTLQRELKVQNVDDQFSDSESSRAPHKGSADSHSNGATSLPTNSIQALPRVTPSGLTDATLLGSAGQPLNNGANYPFNSQGEYDHRLDVNHEYLKHVVLKFVLSREAESVHLIRALSMLLKLTEAEQKLIKETLEYKSSWFGRMPPLGKGQTSKVIPPSY